MQHKITVIIPAYNSLGSLERAVDSAREQTLGFENIRVILADDASSDGTGELCDELAARYPNVDAIHLEKNSGSPGSPRNLALPLVRSPYVMFLDDDDRLEPDGCRLLYEAAESTGADVVSGGCRAESDEKIEGFDPNSELFRNEGLSEGFYDLAALTEQNCLAFCIGVCTKLYRMDIINKYSLRFADGDVCEDNPFLYLYTLLSKTGYIVTGDVFVRTARSASLSRSHSARFFVGLARAMGKGLARARELGIERRYEELLGLAGLLEHMLDCLLADGRELPTDELREIFAEWKDAFLRAYEGAVKIHSPYAKILARSAACGDMASALYDFAALRDFYHQRRSELEGIFSSNTWRLAARAQRLFGGKR